jgi:hypothetical protein
MPNHMMTIGSQAIGGIGRTSREGPEDGLQGLAPAGHDPEGDARNRGKHKRYQHALQTRPDMAEKIPVHDRFDEE